MSHQADDHANLPDAPSGEQDTPIRPRKPYHAPLVIISTTAQSTSKAADTREFTTHPAFFGNTQFGNS